MYGITARLLDGKSLAKKETRHLRRVVETSIATSSRPPCLVVILVGDREDSASYIRMKRKAAEEIGIVFRLLKYRNDIEQQSLEEVIEALNAETDVDGIIVQLPLPEHIEEEVVTNLVHPEKDVDGFHADNVVKLFSPHPEKDIRPYFVSCTARGVVRMIKHTGAILEGKLVVLVGTGNVGKPLALMLLRENATVVCCNKFTNDPSALTRQADIVVAACGVPELVKADWVRPGAIVIDVGINTLSDPTKQNGHRLVGDVAFNQVAESIGQDGWISPVPGGVGPMTVAMLMLAVVDAWQKRSLNKCS